MSHFFTIVITALKSMDDPNLVEESVNFQLAPFEEGLGTESWKWDWYLPGGRYDGVLLNQYRDHGDDGFNFAEKARQTNRNMAFVSDVIAAHNDKKVEQEAFAFAVLTPKGDWIERGSMGWWGMVSDEKDLKEWGEVFWKVLEEYQANVAVGMDLHI